MIERIRMMTIAQRLAVLALVAWLGGCATTEEAPVEERGTGAPAETAPGTETTGVPEPLGPAGGVIGAPARADLLAKRRVHFPFDSSTIDEEARAIIEAHAAHLAANPNLRVRLEGHADERGTREYNLALGERRSQSVERLMRVLGIQANRMTTTSYGEEKPLAPEHDESAWRMNRRVEIIY